MLSSLFFVLILTLIFIYELFLNIVELRSAHNPVPASVSDIYDDDKYHTWQEYHKEKTSLSILISSISYVMTILMVLTGLFRLADHLGDGNTYLALLSVMVLLLIRDLITGLIYGYIDNMVIEQKYGFNRMSLKRFFIDQAKSFVVSAVLECALVSLFAWIHLHLGNLMTLILFSIILIVFMLLVIFLFPILSKGFNKFKPLEEGELKDRLTRLLSDHGYTVKAIEVILASEKTTKSNAYFSGFGKTKTIVLYDNLINSMTTDEIVAVFAHELGHGLHHDTLRLNLQNMAMFACLSFALVLSVCFPDIYTSLGFSNVNYGFAFVILSEILLPFISTVFSLIRNRSSRKAEYAADQQAVLEGLGEPLLHALKKLARENFSHLAPSRITVLLEYSHPTLSDRVEAIEQSLEAGV